MNTNLFNKLLFIAFCVFSTFKGTSQVSLVKDIRLGNQGSYDFAVYKNYVNLNNSLLFVANDGIHGSELWKSMGTSNSTQLVKDIFPGNTNSNIGDIFVYNNIAYFIATYAQSSNCLWRSDGTTNGTYKLTDIYNNVITSANSFTIYNNELYFIGRTDSVFIWKTNGTPQTTTKVDLNISSNLGSFSAPQALVVYNGKLFINYSNRYLYKTSGTVSSTELVKDFYPNNILLGSEILDGGKSVDKSWAIANNFLFFTASGDTNGVELWKTDGTPIGSEMVKDIAIGNISSNPEKLISINGALYFVADDGTHGKEIWKSDGTEIGTQLVSDIFPGTISSIPEEFTVVNGNLFFSAENPTYGKELWKLNLSNGVLNVINIASNPNNGNASLHSGPRTLTNVGNDLYFTAQHPILGRELCKYNTNTNNFEIVQDINNTPLIPGVYLQVGETLGSEPSDLIIVNGTLFFFASTQSTGRELFKLQTNYTITASANTGGTITASGITTVTNPLDTFTYTITADSNHCIAYLLVNGNFEPAASSYSFTNINANQTIEVFFNPKQTFTATLTASANNVAYGTPITFTALSNINFGFSPNVLFKVNGVVVQNNFVDQFTTSNLNNGDVVTADIINPNPFACLTANPAISNSITMIITSAVSPISGISSACKINQTRQLSCVTVGGIWSSLNTNVARVNSNGLVTVVGVGSSEIRYTVGSNYSSIIFRVVPQSTPNSIMSDTQVCVNSNFVASNPTTIPQGGSFVWSSLNSRASITNNGIVMGLNAGSATIRYTVVNEYGCSAFIDKSIFVNPLPSVPNIAYAPGGTNPQAGAPSGSFCRNRSFNLIGFPSGGIWSALGAISINSSGNATIGNAIGIGSVTYTVTNVNGCSSSRTLSGNVVACASRGIDLVEKNSRFFIYPNPAKNVVNIRLDNLLGKGEVILTDLLGKQIKHQLLSLGNNTIDISNLAKGMYIVNIITEQGRESKKLVVE